MLLFQLATTTGASQDPVGGVSLRIGEALGNFNSLIANTDFTSPTWDMFIILFFLVAAFVYGLTLGRERIVLMLISIYIGIAVLRSSPFLDNLIPVEYGPNNVFVFKVCVFLGLFVVLFFLLSRSRVLRTLARSDAPGEWWQVIIFSILHVGLLISITLSFIPEEFYGQLSGFTQEWFLGEQAEFFWIIAPIAAMAFLREQKTENE